MEIHQIDPTKDVRWAELVRRHPHAAVFHTVGWLRALQSTYRYQPVVFTTSSPTAPLTQGLAFCNIQSWLTGQRLVSLPFSDYCDPLCDSSEDLEFVVRYLQAAADRQRLRYFELRPSDPGLADPKTIHRLHRCSKYFLHTIGLRPNLHDLFAGFDASCVQRRIRRAERAGLQEKSGRSSELLSTFYRLFVATRSRHGLPPSPYSWFQNLLKYMGDELEIRVAYAGGTAIAAILTLRFRETVYYKYGCSDTQFNNLGATPWLLWSAIIAARSNGATSFDLGRTDEDNPGLLTFKSHWAPEPTRLTYLRFPAAAPVASAQHWKLEVAKRVFSVMPNAVLRLTGRLLYRHIG